MLFLLAAGEVWTNPIIVGLVVGIPTSLLGFSAYRRAERLDRAASQAAVIAAGGEAVQRVINGLDQIVENLQVDNKEGRELVRELRIQLQECHDAYAALKRMTAGH